MSQVAVIITSMFEDSEYADPAEAFRNAGHSLTHVGLEAGKPVFAICHAGQLLVTADVLKGRRMTGWKSIVQDLKNAGAEFVDQEVVEDGNLISSRHPGDLPAFIDACLKRLS